MFITRRRGYYIFDRTQDSTQSSLLNKDPRSSDEYLFYDADHEDEGQELTASTSHAPKTRSCCGLFVVNTPNSSRFRNHIGSRILQRFPFLIEMFYWVINYGFYRMTSIMSQKIFADTGIWDAAESHGIAVLEAERFGWISFLFPISETSVQQWFMHGHQDALTVLNKAYALIHIPGTVGLVIIVDCPSLKYFERLTRHADSLPGIITSLLLTTLLRSFAGQLRLPISSLS